MEKAAIVLMIFLVRCIRWRCIIETRSCSTLLSFALKMIWNTWLNRIRIFQPRRKHWELARCRSLKHQQHSLPISMEHKKNATANPNFSESPSQHRTSSVPAAVGYVISWAKTIKHASTLWWAATRNNRARFVWANKSIDLEAAKISVFTFFLKYTSGKLKQFIQQTTVSFPK